MNARKRRRAGLIGLGLVIGLGAGPDGGSGHTRGGGSGVPSTGSTAPPPGTAVGAVSGGALVYGGGPVTVVWTPYGPYLYAPPLVVLGRGGYFPPPEPIVPYVTIPVPAEPEPPAQPVVPIRPQARRVEPPGHRVTPRGKELLTFGDRLFRAGNLVRAVERYEQAVKLCPDAAAPRVRLAQVALMRGDYNEAADRLREAQTAEPGWTLAADDIQSVFGEPRVFSKQIERLESHLQTHPGDRDAWLVLGAELFLSGRTARAADVFTRLTDRKADETLQAFLDAVKAAE